MQKFSRVFENLTVEYAMENGTIALKWKGATPNVNQVLTGFYEMMDELLTPSFSEQFYKTTDELRTNGAIYHRESPYGTTTWKIKMGAEISPRFAGQEITLQKGSILSKETWGKSYPTVAIVAMLEEADWKGCNLFK